MDRFLHAVRAMNEAFERLNTHDGWAIASHIALSVLMSLFPFLIVLTATASFLGSQHLAEEAARLLIEAWPREVADPIAVEIKSVLTGTRTDALTIGAILALYFASNGVESLRIGLNRAYAGHETRHWLVLRLESIGFVLLGVAGLLALAFLIVLWPVAWRAAVRVAPLLAASEAMLEFYRLAIAIGVLVVALVFAHKVLPAGKRGLRAILPGIVVTLVLWLVVGIGFGRYLDGFSGTYVTTYAGLATGMIALVFLYFTSFIFLYGAELNAVSGERRRIEPDFHGV